MLFNYKTFKSSILALAMGATLFMSCKKFLDTEPTGTFTEQNFWQSQDDALAGINACYASLRDGNLFGTYGKQMFEILTPNGIISGANDDTGTQNIARGIHNSANTPVVNNKWGACYQGIGRVNSVIARVPGMNINAALRDRIVGEALFLRALYYHELVNYYGNAPLILLPPSLEQVNLPRSAKAEIEKQILADLDAALPMLPVRYSGADVGRATKGASLALKCRVLLYQENWAEAAKAAKAVMDLNAGYQLIADYRSVFLPTNKNNKEVIFDVQFSLPSYGNSYDVNATKYQLSAPSEDLVNSYLASDGLPITQSPLYNPADPYANRDNRLMQTIVLPGSTFINKPVTASSFGTKAIWKKYTSYLDNVAAPTPDYNTNTSFINFIYSRYAEVLLNYAEAQNEAVGPDASVYKALDEIRERTNLPKASLANPGMDQTAMRAFIRVERRIELAGEGFYYDDIRRWKIAETVLAQPGKDISGAVRITRNFVANRDYLWPVPSVQIQQNPKLLPQNPNYLN